METSDFADNSGGDGPRLRANKRGPRLQTAEVVSGAAPRSLENKRFRVLFKTQRAFCFFSPSFWSTARGLLMSHTHRKPDKDGGAVFKAETPTHTQRCKVVTEEIHTFHIAQFFCFLFSFLNLHESPSSLLPHANRAIGTATEPAEDLRSSRSPPRCFLTVLNVNQPVAASFRVVCLVYCIYILFNPTFVLSRVSFPAASPVRSFWKGETLGKRCVHPPARFSRGALTAE